ncbi:MAG: dienelactone hydrolase family protein [Rhodospirillaceae bacterium]|nr:dienelactone hydrolase family protein [Rhodospirillaceae bacterium]
MGEWIEISAEDGHRCRAWLARPSGEAKGIVVVMQEIFGVNDHIRRDTDKFTGHGYVAIAPAVFDRVESGVELGYDEEGFTKGRSVVGDLGWDGPLLDVRAAADAGASATGCSGPVFGVGYCWGGSLAWLAATRLAIPSVGYYGGRTAGLVDERPKAPVMLHFGARDHAIPLADVDKIREAHGAVPIHVYDAGHGFNCDARKDFDPAAADLALKRTLSFFDALA